MSKPIHLFIQGKYDNLNKLIGATNRNKWAGNSMKQRNQKKMAEQIATQLTYEIEPHADFTFHFHMSDRRQDKDNIATVMKYFFDAMQDVNVIKNDGWNEVGDLAQKFYDDAQKGHEYFEVVISWND